VHYSIGIYELHNCRCPILNLRKYKIAPEPRYSNTPPIYSGRTFFSVQHQQPRRSIRPSQKRNVGLSLNCKCKYSPCLRCPLQPWYCGAPTQTSLSRWISVFFFQPVPPYALITINLLVARKRFYVDVFIHLVSPFNTSILPSSAFFIPRLLSRWRARHSVEGPET
jgi:hypothetical protein